MARTKAPLTIEHALLGYLVDAPLHGYGIYQRHTAVEGLGVVWRLKMSRLYALLHKLAERGLLTAVDGQPAEGQYPPRKVFVLTEQGREAFADWVQTPVENGRRLRMEFLAKLYFARRVGEGMVERLVAGQVAMCEQWLAEERARAEEVQGERPHEWLVHMFRVGQVEAMIEWLALCGDE